MENEQKLNVTNFIKLVKSFIVMKDLNLTKLRILVNEKYKKNYTYSNLTKKFRTKSLKTDELLEILDCLDYEVIVREKSQNM